MKMMIVEYLHISAFAVFATLVLFDFTSLRKRSSETNETVLARRRASSLQGKYRTVVAGITLACNIFLSAMYLGFFLYNVGNRSGRITAGAVFSTMSWVLAAAYGFYCKEIVVSENRNWPLVLRSWWVFSGTIRLFWVSVFMIKHYRMLALPEYFPAATVEDIVSFPVSAFLFFVAVGMGSSERSSSELQKPLLSDEDVEPSQKDFYNAGFWSRLVFQWLNPVFEKGHKVRLELEHVPKVQQSDTAEQSFASLQDSLSRQKPGFAPLFRAILRAVWKPLAINAIMAGINTLSSYIGPFLITNFVEFLSDKESKYPRSYGYMLACLFLLAKTVESLSQRHLYFGAQQIGCRIRSALMVCIYNKPLVTKYSYTSTGKTITLMDEDAERIGGFFWYIHGIWLLPIQVGLALIILYRNLGAAASFSAVFMTILVMVCNTPLAWWQGRLQSKIMKAKEARNKATAETLKFMRILKLHSWENAYLNKILRLRDEERKWLKRYLYNCSFVAFLFWASPTLVSVVAFGVCILVKTPLTPGTVLSALATFRILQDPIYNLPELISMISKTKVSLDRIQEFIKGEKQEQFSPDAIKESPDIAIAIEPGVYQWHSDSDSKKSTLQIDEKISIMRGEKVAVCGTVGSGKSSLLYSIIGEIPQVSGSRINVFGSRAFVSQTAWIQTGTIRENILFGKEMYRDLYIDVIKACALDRDISLWVDGDLTIVGERGINLSGGQKQRIQLARAIYSDAHVYFLDDPFSAVDAHTGKHLFKDCLQRFLAQKTVVYVTHQLEFLNTADRVLVLRDGSIVQSGKYEDLINDSNGELAILVNAHRQSLSQVNQSKEQSSLANTQCMTEDTDSKSGNQMKNLDNSNNSNEEKRENGRVKWNVYYTFMTSAYAGALIPVLLLCQILFQSLQMASNYWIAWATETEDRVSREKLIGIFALLSAGSSFFILGRALFLSNVAFETSRKLFLGMINCIFRAPIFFFDTTPSSRILSRSSTDQSTVDTDIPYRLAGLVFALIQLFLIIGLMCQVAWPVIVLFVIIIAISIWYQNYYISTARELARMVGIFKAPVLHHVSESIAGATTIRCFNQEDHFCKKNLNLINDYSRIAYYNSATMEWLCVRINFLFNLVFFAILIILVCMPKDAIDTSLAGVAVTYGLNLNVLQAWVLWNLCNVENKMISVERILQFSSIPSEPPQVIENSRPDSEWPNNGTIEIDNLHVQYSPSLPMVLRGISCTFPGQKKIGIVGRTGSGKSTLIQALFRVVEPSLGRIVIDGVDICRIGLHDLRSRLSIIPQDPTLFQGTVRMNLDPLQQHSDSEIWEVLNKCRLGEIIKQDQMRLDASVTEDGGTWSVGQRQLVCLARVLLQKRRILVLDEATASVDTGTDNFVQKTIREQASSYTLITVAHRIPTVIDSDLVLVLDEGKIVEFGSPTELLKDDSSSFNRLVMEFVGRSSSTQDSELFR